MTNVVKFPFAPQAPVAESEVLESRPPFSFDITQPDRMGLVLIDACVPMALAVVFMELVSNFQPAAS
jgi:hypothetical protein